MTGDQAPKPTTLDYVETARAQLPEGFDLYTGTVALTSPGRLTRALGRDFTIDLDTTSAVDSARLYLGSAQRMLALDAKHADAMSRIEVQYHGGAFVAADPDTDPQFATRRATVAKEAGRYQAAVDNYAANQPAANAMHQVTTRKNERGRFSALVGFIPGAAIGTGLVASMFALGSQTTKAEVPVLKTIPATAPAFGAHAAEGYNPFSKNFRLTGQELSSDKRTVREALSFILRKGDVVTHVSVTGLSSNDTSGPNMDLGRASSADQELASLRKEQGIKALESVARDDHVDITDTEITASSHEAVLQPFQVDQIKSAADSAHETTEQLVTQYDKNSGKVSGLARKILNKLLGDNRGVDYTFDVKGTKEVTKENLISRWQNTELFNVVTLEWMLYLAALPLGFTSAILGDERVRGRLAKMRAMHELNQYKRQQPEA